MAESWFEMLDRAKAFGKEYAEHGIKAGDTAPLESPLNGEFADGITPRDVVTLLAGGDASKFDTLEDWEVTDICDHWEDGYNSAEWPERCPETGGAHQITDGSCDQCGAKNF